MQRSLRERVRNPFNWECHCAPDCWCQTRWGYWLMYYIPRAFTASRRGHARSLLLREFLTRLGALQEGVREGSVKRSRNACGRAAAG
jgi:hypothetical protein